MLSAVVQGQDGERLARLLSSAPGGRALARQHLHVDSTEDALAVARGLADTDRAVALEPLPRPAKNLTRAQVATQAYERLLDALAEHQLQGSEVVIRLTAILAPADAGDIALGHLAGIRARAAEADCSLLLDPAGGRGLQTGLDLWRAAREDGSGAELGVVLSANLHRAERDVAQVVEPGVRVRLTRLVTTQPGDARHASSHAVDRSWVRCLRLLMEGRSRPQIATHDPRLLAIATDLVPRMDRGPRDQEFLLDHRMRPFERARILDKGLALRTNLPYGLDWSGYLARRLLEEPAGVLELPRALWRGGRR